MSDKHLQPLDGEVASVGHSNRLSGLVRMIGLILGPAAFGAVLAEVPLGFGGSMSDPARAVLALGSWMAIWWLTEAAPLPATALLPILILPLTKVCSPEQAAAPFADPLIFVFLGGFVIGKALEVSGLHRRLALVMMLLIGTTPKRMIGAVMLATAIISMFVSNTATAMMMLPLGLSIVALVDARTSTSGLDTGVWDRKCVSNFGAAMLLGIAYASNIGGMGTPIGTPPNLVMTGFLSKLPMEEQVRIGFGQWMIVAMPVLLIMLPVAWGLLTWMLPIRAKGIPGGRAMVREELRALGRMSTAELVVLAVFAQAVGLWVFRQPLVDALGLTFKFAGKERELLTDAGIAIGGALMLLAVPVVRERSGEARKPVISWDQAETLPWGTLLMFGGGLSLAAAIGASGLDKILAGGLESLGGLPHVVMVPLLCLAIVLIGELTSNVALATLLMPILYPAAKALGVPSTELLMMATLSCSMGFMLPVATPPNAIVFATGRIGLGRMIRCGVVMDVVSVGVIAGVLGVFGRVLTRWAGLG